METIIVLSDGETWTVADGCKIMVITDEDLDRLIDDEKPDDISPVMTLGLAEL